MDIRSINRFIEEICGWKMKEVDLTEVYKNYQKVDLLMDLQVSRLLVKTVKEPQLLKWHQDRVAYLEDFLGINKPSEQTPQDHPK